MGGHAPKTDAPVGNKTHGLVAEFSTVDGVIAAASRLRDAGFTKWDVHTPFPVHGLEEAMGIRRTILPKIVLLGGLAGLSGGLLLQWWTNAIDYPYLISGKPMFSLPANIPVIFETTVLLASITAFVCTLALNNLPRLYNPLFRLERFKRATDDKFLVVVEAKDPLYDAAGTQKLLSELGAHDVEVCEEPEKHAGIPRGFAYAGLVLVILSFVPLALAYKARGAHSKDPRIHIIQDMDFQPKYKAQSASPLFADGRAMRPPVAGAVAWGEMRDDTALYQGKDANGAWVTQIPVPVTEATMARGERQFGIYCSACHGLDGGGAGMVDTRATALTEAGVAGWVPAKKLDDDTVLPQPVGELFNTITHGKASMQPYGGQISAEDRWAIVLYIKALQKARKLN